jgi:hypothetical protein
LKDQQMKSANHAIATFDDHSAAESAVKTLAAAGFGMKHISIVGKGYHTDETVTGFYNIEDRVKFWGSRGAFWGGLWGLFMGGMVLSVPIMGQVVVLGYLATTLISIAEGAVMLGSLGALGGALYSVGIPKDSVIAYESAIEADNFLVMVRGSSDEVARGRDLLAKSAARKIDLHAPLVPQKSEEAAK